MHNKQQHKQQATSGTRQISNNPSNKQQCKQQAANKQSKRQISKAASVKQASGKRQAAKQQTSNATQQSQGQREIRFPPTPTKLLRPAPSHLPASSPLAPPQTYLPNQITIKRGLAQKYAKREKRDEKARKYKGLGAVRWRPAGGYCSHPQIPWPGPDHHPLLTTGYHLCTSCLYPSGIERAGGMVEFDGLAKSIP